MKVELFKTKQDDTHTGAEKLSVPVLSLTNMKIALIRWVIEADREKAYNDTLGRILMRSHGFLVVIWAHKQPNFSLF